MPLPDPVERAGNVVAPAGFGVLELLLGGLAALGPLSIDMYLPALPDIGKDFGVLTADVQFSLASFFVGFAAAQLIAGPLVDRYGRRRPLLLALALYVLASLGCAAATSNDWLIFFRLLEGLAGSVAVVVPRAVVRDLHSGAAAVHMLSRLMLVMGVAPIVAPLLGTWVLAGFGWRAIFVFLAGFGALAMLACLRLLPETGRPRDPTATLGNDLRVLAREPDFRAYTLCGGFSSAGMFAYIVGSAFVFQEVHGVSADEYSYFFGANAFGLIAASQLNRVLVGRALRLLAPQPDERVIDWFCGLGNFTLPLATQAREVLGIEGSAALVARSRDNYQKSKADPVVKRPLCATDFVARNLFEMTPEMLVADGTADKWLVDPPREGAFALAKAMADLHQAGTGAPDAPPLPPGAEAWTPPKRIVYVSCNPATLARDAGLLVHQAGYRCTAAGVVNMFPHTAHVESIAVFERIQP